MVFILPLLFLVGAFLGSFLCVLIDRIPKGESYFSGRSKCEHCHKKLSPLELIPIISFLVQNGKCRNCHAKIPRHLIFVELLAGLITVISFITVSNSAGGIIEFILLSVIILSLLGIFVADLLSGIIPDEFTIAIILASFLLIYIQDPAKIIPNLVTGIVALSLFLFLYFVTSGKGMGFGDVKFSFALGFFLGFPAAVVGLYFAFITAAIFSVVLIISGRKKLHGGIIVFGPFLTLGVVFAYFLSSKVLGIFF